MSEDYKFPSVADVYVDNAINRHRKLRAYFFYDVENDCEGDIIIAPTSREALKIGRKDCGWLDWQDFTQMRVTWIKEAKTDGLKVGIVNPQTDDEWFDYIKRNILDYPNYTELPCPKCKQRGILAVYVCNSKVEEVMCETCSEKD